MYICYLYVEGYWMLTKLSNNALVCRMFSSLGGNMVYLYKYPGYVIYASIHWEKDVIFLD